MDWNTNPKLANVLDEGLCVARALGRCLNVVVGRMPVHAHLANQCALPSAGYVIETSEIK